ncbi:MAG: zinc-dependent peptidase [Gemmatimonadaceae bacterium]|nr:zinc-dependent peptidase [Chitinophagaceae bacterium]
MFELVMLVFIGTIILGPFTGRPLRIARNKWIENRAHGSIGRYFEYYDTRLAPCNAYYRSLGQEQKVKFVKRVYAFSRSKKFEYIGVEPKQEMPLLISSAAIQITFGLDKYLFSYFTTIYVLKAEYRYGLNPNNFQGHVNSHGIYLSWENFVRGYEDYTDAHNVGLHEMAHALAFVNFMDPGGRSEDEKFIADWSHFSAVARPIFTEMQAGRSTIFGSYAATNYNEFWAVAVENFFERPQLVKTNMPELYREMCILLNQDPLNPAMILS